MFPIGDSKTDPKNNSDIIREFEELKKNSQLNLRRLKKEKRYRRKLQEQLDIETKRRVQMEEALRMTSAETLKRITESLSRSEGGVSAMDNSVIDSAENVNKRGSANSPTSKDRRDSGDDPRSSPASSSTSHVAIAAAAAAAAAAAQFNATVSTSEASSDRGTPPRGKKLLYYLLNK